MKSTVSKEFKNGAGAPLCTGTWVASRNWSPLFQDLTCLFKKMYNLETFHYFSVANQNFVKILVATCSSHHCGPKMPLNLYVLAAGKYIFLAMKSQSGARMLQFLSKSLYNIALEKLNHTI